MGCCLVGPEQVRMAEHIDALAQFSDVWHLLPMHSVPVGQGGPSVLCRARPRSPVRFQSWVNSLVHTALDDDG